MKMLALNCNDIVQVKLTPFGECVLHKARVKEYEEIEAAKITTCEALAAAIFDSHPKDERGYREFQLYELFDIFGETFFFTAQEVPFVGNEILVRIPEVTL